jgi:uncharacterized membrane protein YeaQ/YmgE (transglycosylase-associated protein family)
MGIAVEPPETGSCSTVFRLHKDSIAMFHIVVWLVVGALVGLVAGLLMRGDDDQSVFVNVLVGVLGALIAGWVVAPYFGLHAGDPKVLDFGALSVALVGAIVSLALLSLIRNRRG